VRVTIFDYGAGNLHSLAKSLALPDVQLRVDDDPAHAVVHTDVLVLPGVGGVRCRGGTSGSWPADHA